MKPDYTVRDLFSYGGFICGAATFMVSSTAWHVHELLRVLCAVVVGLIVGFVTVSTYDKLKTPGSSGGGSGTGRRNDADAPDDNDEFGPKW